MPNNLIDRFVRADVPLLLWGAPGGGKTSAAVAYARQHGMHCHVLAAESAQDADITGVRVPGDGRATWLPPDWVLDVEAALRAGQRALLVIDEITAFPRPVEAALLGLVANRRFGGRDLAGLTIVATANPPEMAADGRPISAATANRFAHCRWVVDPTEWAAGARAGWGAPQSPATAAARSAVASYVVAARTPGRAWWDVPPLHMVPADYAGGEEAAAYPSPRSWDAVCRLLAATAEDGLAYDAAAVDIALTIGDAAAERFLSWLREQEYSVEDLLAEPNKCVLPQRQDKLLAALCGAATAATAAHPDRPARWAAAWRLIERVASDQADVAVIAAGILCRAHRDDAAIAALGLPPITTRLGDVLRAVRA